MSELRRVVPTLAPGWGDCLAPGPRGRSRSRSVGGSLALPLSPLPHHWPSWRSSAPPPCFLNTRSVGLPSLPLCCRAAWGRGSKVTWMGWAGESRGGVDGVAHSRGATTSACGGSAPPPPPSLHPTPLGLGEGQCHRSGSRLCSQRDTGFNLAPRALLFITFAPVPLTVPHDFIREKKVTGTVIAFIINACSSCARCRCLPPPAPPLGE